MEAATHSVNIFKQAGAEPATVLPQVALDDLVKLTPVAVDMVKEAIKGESDLKPDSALRVFVQGGGCSGLKYGLNFDETPPTDDDLELSQNGVRIYLDHFSAMFLRGTTIDYVTSMNGSGFKFLNPNAQRTCGCGSSFSG